MDDEQKIWERALIKCGLWKPETYCMDCSARSMWSDVGYKMDQPHHPTHFIPAPPLNDAATAFAMLRWYISAVKADRMLVSLGHDITLGQLLLKDDLPLAIARAVLATQEAA